MASEAEDFGAAVYDEIEEIYAMNAIADPVLAELWNNERDAQYDRLYPGLYSPVRPSTRRPPPSL